MDLQDSRLINLFQKFYKFFYFIFIHFIKIKIIVIKQFYWEIYPFYIKFCIFSYLNNFECMTFRGDDG